MNKPVDFNFNLNNYLHDNRIDFLSYVNADVKFVKKIDTPFVGFHVIRDPRDIVISAYFSHRNSHSVDGWPELIGHRAKLRSEGFEEGLLRELDFEFDLMTDGVSLHPFRSMAEWNYKTDNILELRYEDMVGRSSEFFLEIFDCLGIVKSWPYELTSKAVNRLFPGKYRRFPCINKPKLISLLGKTSFASLSGGRQLGSENTHSHYRKGIPGEWSSRFSQKVESRFKKMYPGLISRLGYEKDENW